MTVTIASTTDTVQEVEEATAVANEEPTPVVEAEASTDPVEGVEAQPEESAEEPEPLEAAGEVATEDDEVGETAEEPEEEQVAAPEEANEAEEAPKKKRGRRRGRSYKERASQLAREKAVETARSRALEEENAALRRAAQEQRQSAVDARVDKPEEDSVREDPVQEETEPKQEASEEEVAKKPLQENYETYDEFQEALVDWKVESRLQAHEAKVRDDRQREQEAQRAQEAVAAQQARIDKFRSEHEDFDAVIAEADGNLPLSAPMRDVFRSSEHGPELMYYLCKNPDECDRIAYLHPLEAIKEMGKIEARFEVADSGPTSQAEPVTRAPRPIKPVGGGATASSVPLDQMSYQDFKRAREKHLATQNQR
jgi:hypothetical protein